MKSISNVDELRCPKSIPCLSHKLISWTTKQLFTVIWQGLGLSYNRGWGLEASGSFFFSFFFCHTMFYLYIQKWQAILLLKHSRICGWFNAINLYDKFVRNPRADKVTFDCFNSEYECFQILVPGLHCGWKKQE